jgi:hypothetical protein
VRTLSACRSAAVAAVAVLVASCQSDTEPAAAIDHLQISLSPARASYPPSDTARATVVAFSPDGTWLPTGVAQWRSLDPGIAAVSPSGLITAVSRGSATIEAEVDSVTAQVQIEVRGVLHTLSMSANETWLVADTPHVVRGYLRVGGLSLDVKDTTTLTVSPGATVRFRPGSGLYFADIAPGRLVIPAGGDPVVMEGDSAARGSWVGLAFLGPGRSELRNLTLRQCGALNPSQYALPCLLASGHWEGSGPDLLIDGVTITDAHDGMNIWHWVTFAPGSRNLSIENTDGYVAIISPQVMGTFPLGGTFAGNAEQEIRVTNGLVEHGATWSPAPLPWRLMGLVQVAGPDWPTINVAAGVHILADPAGGIAEGQGRLLVGDEAGPAVVLESTGDGWGGIGLAHGGRTVLRNVVMRDCGLAAPACLFFNGPEVTDTGLVVQDVAIRGAYSPGIRVGWGGLFNAASRNLAITEGASVPLETVADAVPSIPPGDYTLNAVNVIRVSGGDVWRDATWHNLGLPYQLPAGLVIGSIDVPPTLTVEPGVTFEMGVGTNFLIGFGGTLHAVGTAADSILFTSATPGVPGSWGGVDLAPEAMAGTRLRYVEIRDAGAYGGAMRLGVDPGGLLWNSTIRRSPSCGLMLLAPAWTDDYTAPAFGNAFVDVDGPSRCGPIG